MIVTKSQYRSELIQYAKVALGGLLANRAVAQNLSEATNQRERVVALAWMFAKEMIESSPVEADIKSMYESLMKANQEDSSS